MVEWIIEPQVRGNPEQQWTYHRADGTFSNAARPGYVTENFWGVKEVSGEKSKGGSNVVNGLTYSNADQIIQTSTGNVLSYTELSGVYYARLLPNTNRNDQFWHVEYCDNYVP